MIKPLVNTVKNGFDTPAPRWFRITKRLITLVSTFVMTILMAMGHRADDLTLLVINLSTQFALEAMDIVLTNGQVYADLSQIKDSKKEVVEAVKEVTN